MNRRGTYLLTFLLSLIFSVVSNIPIFLVVAFFGLPSQRDLPSVFTTFHPVLTGTAPIVFLVIFYLFGRHVDFVREHSRLALLALAGVFLGAIPQFTAIQTTLPLSDPAAKITDLVIAPMDWPAAVQIFASAFESFAVPVGGLALSFLVSERRQQTLASSSGGGTTGGGESGRMWALGPTLSLFITGFAVVFSAYVAQGLVDVFLSRFPGNDQFAFLRAVFVSSPESVYAFAFFYPLLFFALFYFLGTRLDLGRMSLKQFALPVLLAGLLSILVGLPLQYYIRSLEAMPGRPLPPFNYGLEFFGGSITTGLYTLTFAFAATSLGLSTGLAGAGKATAASRLESNSRPEPGSVLASKETGHRATDAPLDEQEDSTKADVPNP